MGTYLLTWNPASWAWDDYEREAKLTARGQTIACTWSCGIRRHGIEPGDRAFLLRQGTDRRGLIASGVFTSLIYEDEHWDGTGRVTTYADAQWDNVLTPDDRLPIEILQEEIPDVHWTPQGSGVTVPTAAEGELEGMWRDHLRNLGRGT